MRRFLVDHQNQLGLKRQAAWTKPNWIHDLCIHGDRSLPSPPDPIHWGQKQGLHFACPRKQRGLSQWTSCSGCCASWVSCTYTNPKTSQTPNPTISVIPNSPCCASAANCGLAGWGHRLWQGHSVCRGVSWLKGVRPVVNRLQGPNHSNPQCWVGLSSRCCQPEQVRMPLDPVKQHRIWSNTLNISKPLLF